MTPFLKTTLLVAPIRVVSKQRFNETHPDTEMLEAFRQGCGYDYEESDYAIG